MIICGIDPGLSGALAFYDTDTGDVETADMPTFNIARAGKAKRDIDRHTLSDLLYAKKVGHAVVEEVWSMPGQGVSSTFAFGKGYGIVLGILAAIGISETGAPPRKWKKAMSVGEGKDASRARASQLFPSSAEQWRLKKHDGRAEAALLAMYGWQSTPIRGNNLISKNAHGVNINER